MQFFVLAERKDSRYKILAAGVRLFLSVVLGQRIIEENRFNQN